MKYLVSTILLWMSLSLHAQVGRIFTTDDMLCNSYVNEIFQDRDGFIWIATRNGLMRYDGYQFKTFKKGINDSGIESNYINCIDQDREGNLYIGGNTTVQRYKDGKFITYELYDRFGKPIHTYFTDILQLSNGKVIAASSGFGIMQLLDNDKAEIINHDKRLNYPLHFAEDNQKNLWVATTTKGLFVIRNNQIKQQYFKSSNQRSALSDVICDKLGNVWVSLHDQGLWLKRPNEHDFHQVKAVGNLPISDLNVNQKGEIFIGTDGAGVYIYQPKHDLLLSNPYYCKDIYLNQTKVYSILEDHNHNIWLGLFQKGVFMSPCRPNEFCYMGQKLGPKNVIGFNCISAILVDSKHHVWVGTDKDHLYQLDSQMHLIKHYTNVPGTIIIMHEDAKHRIWIGSYQQGLGYIDEGGIWHAVNLNIGDNISIFGLDSDQEGNIWIGTSGQGLICYNPDTKQKKQFKSNIRAKENKQLNCLINDYISGLAVSHNNQYVYTATSTGLAIYDKKKKSWTSALGTNCPDYDIFSRFIREDKDGNVYMGTNVGLYIYNLKTRKKKVLTIDDGLPDNGVASMEQDYHGNLWITTDHGLCCMHPKTGKTKYYYSDKVLQGNEFSNQASYITPDRKTIYLGGSGGVTWFHVDSIKQQPWNATIKVSTISIGNNEQSVNPDDTEFEFNYEDNSFAIHLSTLTYDEPDNIVYLYSINNEDWVELSHGSNELAFNHLSPGTYHIRVKACLNDKSTPIREFTIEVNAPWYRSNWAYFGYLIILLCLLKVYHKYRQRKLHEEKLIEENKHQEELNESRLKSFINISHDIRTPMTLIISPLQQLLQSDTDPSRHATYRTIQKNAVRILHLINQIMDLRKIDRGLMAMNMRKTDMVKFISDVYALFIEQAKMQNIDFSFEHDSEQLYMWIDRNNFDKVLVNIISNAFKYTYAGGKIEIRLTHNDKEAEIAFYDNGERIPDDQIKHIFDRFYQANVKSNDRKIGTGIGLDLTRSLVELHYGTISVHNNADGKGCEFNITLPLGKEHLSEAELINDTQDTESETYESAEVLENTDNINTIWDIPAIQVAVHANKMDDDANIILPTSNSTTDTNASANEKSNTTKPIESDNNTKQENEVQKISIFVVEDDFEIATYLKEQFRREFDVSTFANGKDALSAAIRQQPQLIISDVMMPVMDGITLCKRLRDNTNTNAIPIILLTAKNSDEDKLKGIDTGADAYMVKPFNIDLLKSQVFNLIRQRRTLMNKLGGQETQEEKLKQLKLNSADDRLIEMIVEEINKNLTNSDLNVDMLAEKVGLSRVHLYRKMKELTNQTPHGFIRNTRIRQAARLLREPGHNVTEVMYACGFSNLASFSTMFKSMYGMSPRDYIREHQK